MNNEPSKNINIIQLKNMLDSLEETIHFLIVRGAVIKSILIKNGITTNKEFDKQYEETRKQFKQEFAKRVKKREKLRYTINDIFKDKGNDKTT